MSKNKEAWTYKGYRKDEINHLVNERRGRVLTLIREGNIVAQVAEKLGVTRAVTRNDVATLIRDGLLTAGEVHKRHEGKRKWVPTPETVILIAEMLRSGNPFAEISRVVGVTSQTSTKWIKQSTDPIIVKALRERATALKPKPTGKREPTKSEKLAESILRETDMTCEEVSRRNMKEFYADEVEEWNNNLPIHIGDRRVLFRYGLIENRKPIPGGPIGNKKTPGKKIVIMVPSLYEGRPPGHRDGPPQWLRTWQDR